MGHVTVGPYQRQLFYGNAGTTATTQVLSLIEADVNIAHDYEATDVRGDGTVIPIMTEQPVKRKCEVKFKLRNLKNGTMSADVIALIAKSRLTINKEVAIKVVSYSGGLVEFDGDVTLDLEDPNSRELSFTCHTSREAGREPSF